jgi:hypothetical protein
MSPRPVVFFRNASAASFSKANGNSSLSFAPLTNAGAKDLDGFTPSWRRAKEIVAADAAACHSLVRGCDGGLITCRI